MSVYLCRWPNGDISLVSASSRLAIDEVLDEVGNPDSAEMIPIRHAVAVHFRLKDTVADHLTVPDFLEFGGIDERSYLELLCAYPILHEVLQKEEATDEEIAAAVEQEKKRVEIEPPDLSDDTTVALIQLQMNMPKRLAQLHEEVAKANTRKKC